MQFFLFLQKNSIYMLTLNRTKDFHLTDKCIFDILDNSSLLSQLSRKSDWQFRIYAQCLMRSKMNYLIYFVTLTYSNYSLPTFSMHYGYCDFNFPCFSREDIKCFIRGLTRDLRKYHNVIDVDYIVCSEFGDSTSRPHYHLLLLIPRFKHLYKGFFSDCDAVNAMRVHELIVKHWSFICIGDFDKFGVPLRKLRGWVLPANPFGGFDSKGYNHKPLLVDPKNLASACIYVSKYCTKQLGFYKVPKFSSLFRLAKKNGDVALMRKLRNISPFIKTSLHFGECINDLVLSPFVPWAKGVFFTENQTTFEKLYDGVWTPLYKKRPLQLPRYNKRKLLEVRTLVDKYSYIDYSTNTKKHVYTYSTSFSSLYLSYAPYEYRRKVDDVYFKISTFYSCHFLKDSFTTWLCGFSDESYDSDVAILSHFNDLSLFRALAVYRVAYQDRILPCYHSYDSYYNDEVFPYFDSTILDADFLEYDKVIIDKTSYASCSTEIDSFKPFSPGSWLSNDVLSLFPSFRYNGNESLDIMCMRAKSYYLSKGKFIHNPLKEIFCPYPFAHLLFNNMPCFANFDRLLFLIFSYFNYITNQRLKAIDEKEVEKKRQIDLLFG